MGIVTDGSGIAIPTRQLTPNKGQLVEKYGEELAANPRYISKVRFELLKQSIQKENLNSVYPLVVYPHKKKYVVLSGNSRLKAFEALNIKEVFCIILDEGSTLDDIKRTILVGNTHHGEWDHDMLANTYDPSDLLICGYNVPLLKEEELEDKSSSINPEEKDGTDYTVTIKTKDNPSVDFIDIINILESNNVVYKKK